MRERTSMRHGIYAPPEFGTRQACSIIPPGRQTPAMKYAQGKSSMRGDVTKLGRRKSSVARAARAGSDRPRGQVCPRRLRVVRLRSESDAASRTSSLPCPTHGVVPGRREAASPGTITTSLSDYTTAQEYRLRAPARRSCGPSLRPRNDVLRIGERNVINGEDVIYAVPHAQQRPGSIDSGSLRFGPGMTRCELAKRCHLCAATSSMTQTSSKAYRTAPV